MKFSDCLRPKLDDSMMKCNQDELWRCAAEFQNFRPQSVSPQATPAVMSLIGLHNRDKGGLFYKIVQGLT